MINKIGLKPIALTGLFLALIIIAVLKIIYVDNFVFRYTGVRHLGATRVIINDAAIQLAIVSLFYLSYFSRTPYMIAITLRTMALIMVFVYAIDFYVLANFATHLTIASALKYAPYAINYIQQAHGINTFMITAALILSAGLMAFMVLSRYRIQGAHVHAIFIALIIASGAASILSFSADDKYIHSWIYKNVISHNLTVLSENKKYSETFVQNFEYQEPYECVPGISEKPDNIIILMVESLSNYQSQYFSGIRNWTPNLDSIAGENIAYVNHYANGFTTEDGEISLLTGQLPIYGPLSYSDGGGVSFTGFFDFQKSLPNILKNHGYRTEFLTTSDLNFSETGRWARSVGFDYVEGHEHPYYDKWPRFHFNAAPDEALYDRILQRIKSNSDDKKSFYFVKTVSTHHPFIDPLTRNKSEEQAFKYADMKLGEFYEKLVDMSFFDQGMLIIVGDHHAMVPLKREEIDLFGPAKASAMVPLVVAYGGRAQRLHKRQYQQIDVFNSLKGLVSGRQHYSNWTGSIFDGASAKYIAHRRGDNRSRINIISGDQIGTVKLDGDATRIVSAYPQDIRAKKEILGKINSVRLRQSRTASRKASAQERSKGALVARAASACL